MRVEQSTNADTWNQIVNEFGGHPLQLWGWGEVKAAHGWRAERFTIYGEGGGAIAGAQVLVKKLPKPFCELLYIPRGPFGEAGQLDEAVRTLVAEIKKRHPKALQIIAEPDSELMDIKGWKRSDNTILIPRTLILDLCKSEDELKASMVKKTRQYINKSSREALEVRDVTTKAELAKCLAIYRETAHRSQFALHDDAYYYDVAQEMGQGSQVFAAYHDGEPVAFLWLAVSDGVAFELYGGMNETGQRLRANYMLKWHAIMACKEAEVKRYDLNGLLNDGISSFKQGFASHETMLAGTYIYSLSPLSLVWEKVLPMARRVLRAIKKRRA